MKRYNGFGLGFSQSPVRGLAIERTLLLGQSKVSSSEGGEPDLSRALAPLSRAEAADYQGWGPPEKTLFLLGYQYLAAATAKDLERPDGSQFNGFLPDGISSALTILGAAAAYDLGPLSAALDGLSKILKGASDKTENEGQKAVRKYRLLRDRIAWEMANSGVVVKFDVMGDDPANPGVVYQRQIGGEGSPDLNAVFSFKTPAQMYQAGKELEAMYAKQGVPFDRPKLGAGSAFPVLGAIIAIIAGILLFFYLFWNHGERAKLHDTTVDLIMKDPKMTPEEKADALMKLRSAESFWGEIFGAFPWTVLIVTAGIAAIAFFALPSLLLKKVKA